MKLWDNIKLYCARKLNVPGFTLMPNMFWNWFQGTRNKKFNQVLPKDPTYQQLRSFARNAILRIPIEHIEDVISRLPIEISPVDPNDTKDYTQAKQQIMNTIRNPNLVQSWVPFSKMILEDLLVVGAGAFQKCIGGDPRRKLYLYPTDSSTLQFVVPYDYQNPNAARYMQQQPDGMKFFSSQEVAYLQKNYFSDRPQGLSPVRAAYDYIVYLLNASERADEVAKNATSDFLIHFKGMDDTKRKEFIKYMSEEIEGTGTIPVSAGPDDVQTAQIRAINKDNLVLEYQEFLRVVVGLAFKYPWQRMGIIRSGDRSTSYEIDNQIMENCVKPWAFVIEDALNDHIVTPLGYGGILKVSFVFAETEDQKTAKSNRLIKELVSGGITENEFRKAMGYPKSNSKYADMTTTEKSANINKDLGINGMGNFGDAKNNYKDVPTKNKTD